MQKLLIAITLLFSLLSTACSQQSTIIGSDRDDHGCATSAGYQWCAKKELCVRPWELEKQDKTSHSEGSFSHYCHNE